MMEKKFGSTNRYLALLAGLTALYVSYGYASGVALQHNIRELDLFFLISALFTILVCLTGRPWSATILGTINGLLLFGDPSAPVGIGLSLIPNGLVFDMIGMGRSHPAENLSKNRLAIAGALGNLAMGAAGVVIAISVGALKTMGLPFIISLLFALVGNPIVGALGALFGTIVVERVGEGVKSPLIH